MVRPEFGRRLNGGNNRISSSQRIQQLSTISGTAPRGRTEFQAIQDKRKQEQINQEINKFNQNLSYENYEQKYNSLSLDARRQVTSFEQVKQTPEYQQWKAAYDEQQRLNFAYNWINRKAAGKRGGAITKEQGRLIEKIISENPSIRRALDNAAELKGRGFTAKDIEVGKRLGMDFITSDTGAKIALTEKGAKQIQAQASAIFNDPSLAAKISIKDYKKIYGVDARNIANTTIKQQFEIQKILKNPALAEKTSIQDFKKRFGVDAKDLVNQSIRDTFQNKKAEQAAELASYETYLGRKARPSDLLVLKASKKIKSGAEAGDRFINKVILELKEVKPSNIRKKLNEIKGVLLARGYKVSNAADGTKIIVGRNGKIIWSEKLKTNPLKTIKGESFISRTKTNLKNELKKRGVPINKINNISDSFYNKVKNSISTDSLKDYQMSLQKTRTSLLGDLNSIKPNQQKLLADVSSEINKKNLTQSQKDRLIKQKLTADTLKQTLTGVSIMGNILAIKAADTLISLGVATPQLLRALKTAPLTTLASLPPAILDGVAQDLTKTKTSNGLAIPELVVEYYTIGKVFKVIGKTSGKVLNTAKKLSPKYYRWSGDKLIVRKAPAEVFKVRGQQRFLTERVQKPSIKRPIKTVVDKAKGRKRGQFRKFQKDEGLVLTQQTVKKSATEYAVQLQKYSGLKVTGVNAAADIRPLLGGGLRRAIRTKQLVRKPLIGSSYLDDYIQILAKAKNKTQGREIVRLLKKLDSGGKLTITEVAKLNGFLRKNYNPNLSILERSLYLSPDAGIRLSRLQLGKEPEARLRDIFRLNFKFRGAKPGVLVFEGVQIAKVPKNIITIGQKISKKGVSYKGFEKDWATITKWSNKVGAKPVAYPGGSPIYKGGIELEITIPPGEFIRKVKKIATFQEPKSRKIIPVYTAEVYRPPKNLASLIKKAKEGKLSKSQVLQIERKLSKELKKKVRIETPELLKSKKYIRATRANARRADTSIPVLRLDRIAGRAGARGLRVFAYISKRGRTPKRTSRSRTRARTRVTRGKVQRTKRTTRKTKGSIRARKGVRREGRTGTPRQPRPGSPRPPRPGSPRPPRPGSPRPPVTGPIPRGYRVSNLRKPKTGYYVAIKRKNKLVRLNPKPFSMDHAKDFLAYKIDNGLSRTAFYIPVGVTKKVVIPPKLIQGYFGKIQKKLRPYKIRQGKKRELIRGYIEKRTYFSDTPGEKRALKVRNNKPPRRQSPRPSKRPTRTRRKISLQQRRVLIARLKRARAVRMRNLKRQNGRKRKR